MINIILSDFLKAYNNAKESGKYLAEFILATSAKYPKIKFDLLGHSLGTVVVQSTVSNLKN